MVTQQFHETLEPLSEWLTATEKHLVHSEPIGTETSKLEDQISQHKVTPIVSIFFQSFVLSCNHPLPFNLHSLYCFKCPLLFPILFFIKVLFLFYVCVCVFCSCHSYLVRPTSPRGQALEEEIMNHSKDLFQAVSLGQMLRSVSSVDDKEFVQSKLDGIQAGYIELQERCRRKAEMLQQALANAQLFGEDEVALMNWLNEMHSRLNEVSVEDYKIDVLVKQLKEQRVHTPPQAKHYVFSFSFLICSHHVSLVLRFLC